MQRHKINSIQALRAIAVILVVHTHHFLSGSLSLQAKFYFLSGWGGIGVDLFFVISGFIMITILPKYTEGNQSPVDFMLKRLVRIVPLYWLLSFLILFLSRHNPNVAGNTYSILKTLVFFPVFGNKEMVFALIPQGWTLGYELYFYLIIFIGLCFVKTKLNLKISAALILLSVIGCFIKPDYLLSFLTSSLLLEFVFGIVIALAYKKIAGKPLTIADHKKYKNWALISLCAGLLLMLSSIFIDNSSFGLAQDVAKSNILAIERVAIWGIPCALFIYGVVMSELLLNIKVPSFLIIVGDASFSCYLIHVLLMGKLNKMIFSHFTINADLYIIADISLVLIFSVLFYRLVEKPLTSILYKLCFKGRK